MLSETSMLFVLFATATVMAGALTVIAVRRERPFWLRGLSLALLSVLLLSGYGGFSELLSRPKPTSMEWMRAAQAEVTVLASSIQEEVAIYVWLRLEGQAQPRAYVLPWDLETAKRLQRATHEAKAKGTRVRMKRPFARKTEAVQPVIYAEPQKPLPPKRVARQRQESRN